MFRRGQSSWRSRLWRLAAPMLLADLPSAPALNARGSYIAWSAPARGMTAAWRAGHLDGSSFLGTAWSAGRAKGSPRWPPVTGRLRLLGRRMRLTLDAPGLTEPVARRGSLDRRAPGWFSGRIGGENPWRSQRGRPTGAARCT